MVAEEKEEETKQKATTGYFENGLPYARFGNSPRVLVVFEALNFENKPPSGMMLKTALGNYKDLTQEFTVYLIGRKQGLPSGYSIMDMSEDYVATIRKELRSPVDVMGISTGGAIAQVFAAEHPEMVHHLVLAMTAHRLSDEGKLLQRKMSEFAKQDKWGKAYAASMDGIYPRSGFKKHFFKLVMWLIGVISAPASSSDFVVTVEAEEKCDYRGQLQKINAPTLIIGGEEDFFYPIQETVEAMPNAERVIYKGFGHNAFTDNNRRFQKDILNFLNKGK